MPTITTLTPADYAQWRPLWDGYLTFYDATVPERVTQATWSAILASPPGVIGRGVRIDDRMVGFTLSIIHPSTWRLGPSFYLEDLFVDPAERGHGLGRALIDDVFNLAKTRGCNRIYWHTRDDNGTARRLYDRYGLADAFVRYRFEL